MRIRRIVLGLGVLLGLVAVALGALAWFGWPASEHVPVATERGVSASSDAMEAVIDEPGPILVETVVGADWQVDRAGLIDLEDPRAREAGLVAGMEPIQIYFHALVHPTQGTFLIDTGVERALFEDPDRAAVRGLVTSLAGMDLMHRRTDTATWLAAHPAPITAVLLTHLHLDHVTGLADVPAEVPVIVGEGEAESRSFLGVLTQPSADRALEGHRLEAWRAEPDPSGRFASVIDVLGDGTLWAIGVPGHTHGSMAFVARTPEGPVLFTGDASHTAWGWTHDVGPGMFSEDPATGVESLRALRELAARHPSMRARLGHQSLEEAR